MIFACLLSSAINTTYTVWLFIPTAFANHAYDVTTIRTEDNLIFTKLRPHSAVHSKWSVLFFSELNWSLVTSPLARVISSTAAQTSDLQQLLMYCPAACWLWSLIQLLIRKVVLFCQPGKLCLFYQFSLRCEDHWRTTAFLAMAVQALTYTDSILIPLLQKESFVPTIRPRFTWNTTSACSCSSSRLKTRHGSTWDHCKQRILVWW